MALDDSITLIIEGLPEDDGDVRLAAFMSQLQNLSATLSRLDRDANNGKAASYFRIAELSYSSPVRVVIKPNHLPKSPYVGHIVVQNLGRIAEALENGHDLTQVDADILEDIRGLVRPVGKTVKNATLVFNDHRLDLTEKIGIKIDEALAVDEECDG